jgi:hypothetical protein
MISIRCCCVFIVLLFMCAQASAKGCGMHSEDRYNPKHIDSLPPEFASRSFTSATTLKLCTPSRAIPIASSGSSCTLSTSSAMETAAFAPLLAVCIRSGFPLEVIIGLFAATTPRQETERNGPAASCSSHRNVG